MILGANLTKMDAATFALLTNRDLIAVNQMSTESAQVLHDGNLIVWKAKLPEGEAAVAMFNVGDTKMKVDRRFAGFGVDMGPGAWSVRDVWAAKDEGSKRSVTMELAPHACVLLILRKGR